MQCLQNKKNIHLNLLIGQLSFTFTGFVEFKSKKSAGDGNGVDNQQIYIAADQLGRAKSFAGRSTTQSSVKGSQKT